MKKILIVDDDPAIGNLLEETLTRAGYRAVRAYSGTEALLSITNTRPDLVLLDLMLPGLTGEELLPKLKGIPVIVLSAKVDVDNKVNLLLGGAVDYVTKPFNTKELLARITVQLRNATVYEKASVLTFEDIALYTDTHSVIVNEAEVRLTRTEYAILKLLLQNPSQVLPKSLLLERISEDTPDCTEGSMKTHVSHLRGKLSRVGGRDFIETVRGAGFRLVS